MGRATAAAASVGGDGVGGRTVRVHVVAVLLPAGAVTFELMAGVRRPDGVAATLVAPVTALAVPEVAAVGLPVIFGRIIPKKNFFFPHNPQVDPLLVGTKGTVSLHGAAAPAVLPVLAGASAVVVAIGRGATMDIKTAVEAAEPAKGAQVEPPVVPCLTTTPQSS